MSFEACLNEIKAAARGRLTDEQLLDALNEVMQRRDEVMARDPSLGFDDAGRQASEELAAETTAAAVLAKRNAVLNLRARQGRRARLLATDDPVDGLRREIHATATPVDSARFSADAVGKSLARDYIDRAVSELDHGGLFAVARGGKLERKWVQELAELSKDEGGRPGISGSEPARRIAEILNRAQELAKSRLNRAGAWIGDYAGWVAHTQHNPDKIYRAGYDAWRAAIMDALDQARTFRGIGDKEKFLRGIYGALTTGVHLTADGGRGFKDPAFSGPGNLAARLSEGRVLHFRDADAWLDYQKRFGEPDALQSVMNGLGRAARDTALMRRWGTNPRAEFENDLRWLGEQLRDRNPEAVKQLGKKDDSLWHGFDLLDGTAERPKNRLGARVGAALRLDESMAKLGGVLFTHLSVGATKAAELRYHGVGYLEAWSNFLASFLSGRGRSGSETREIMDRLLAGIEGMRGELLSRFSPDDTLPGTLSKLGNRFFKLSGLSWALNVQKAGLEFGLSRHYGALLGTAGRDLPEEEARVLSLYGIGPKEWDIVRQATDHPSIDGRAFLVPDAVDRTNAGAVSAQLRSAGQLAAKADRGTIARGVADWREDMALRLNALFRDSAERGVITPGIAEKAILLRGTKPGTVMGEVARFFAQFKQWPVAAARIGLGRELYGGKQLLTGPLSGKQSAVAGILHIALGTTLLGYLAMSLKALFKGETPRAPNDPRTWAAALAQGGGAGILGDYLFGEFDRFGHNPLVSAAGPVAGALDDLVLAYNDAKNGNKKGFDAWWHRLASDALNFGKENAPFINLFYTRLALDYLFLWQVQEALNPGFLRRFQTRVQQQNHQSFFLQPAPAFGGRR